VQSKYYRNYKISERDFLYATAVNLIKPAHMKKLEGVSMLYIGHFSFDEIGGEQEIRHGCYTTVVNADNVSQAVIELREVNLF